MDTVNLSTPDIDAEYQSRLAAYLEERRVVETLEQDLKSANLRLRAAANEYARANRLKNRRDHLASGMCGAIVQYTSPCEKRAKLHGLCGIHVKNQYKIKQVADERRSLGLPALPEGDTK